MSAGRGVAPPRDLWIEANRLRLHLADWGEGADDREPLLLLHGLLEHGRAWDLVAPALAASGRRVLALDWRGHGDSEWVGRGGYYHFADYVADLGFVVRALGGRVALVGHSMGGNAALTYAGTEPDRVTALVSIEGFGPPGAAPEDAPERFRGWIDDLERAARRTPRELTLEEAANRLAERFTAWPAAVATHMAAHATRPVAGSERARTWKFDPLHQTRSPQPFYTAQARAFWREIRCPALYVEGTRSFISAAPLEIDERVRTLGARRATIEGAAHHPHLERPAETVRALLDFLDSGSQR